MNRRHFLGTLAAAAAGFALDPERALWTPGAKTIFLPPVTRLGAVPLDAGFLVGDVFTIEGLFAVNPATGLSTGQSQSFVVTDMHGGFMPPMKVPQSAFGYWRVG